MPQKKINPFLRTIFIVLIIMTFSACSKKTITLQFKTIPPLPNDHYTEFQAGIAMTDITPPPGLPLAGYSTLSADGIGFRTRLKARAFYFKPVDEKPVAIVQCDLLSGSRILHHSVSEKIASQTDISSSGLVIYGSHTHTGPGNYFASHFYNSNASNRSGFDYQLFRFLSIQIADAIIKAYKNKRPAKLATGVTTVHKATRNRSLPAYLNNQNIKNKDNMNIYTAVNPTLYMIRVDLLSKEGKYYPCGAISFFSIHPNIKPQLLNNLYSGDIIAYIERNLENHIQSTFHPFERPIHAVINMTHGDNNPNLPKNENFVSARHLGEQISQKVITLFTDLSQSLKAEIPIFFRSKDIDVLKQNKVNDVTICSQPVIGCSVLGGAKGKGSFLQHIPPFSPGWPKKWFTGSCQGTKQKVLGPFHSFLFQKHHYPHHLMGQIIQIDNLMLLPLPFEITFESGNRMADHMRTMCQKNNKSEIQYVLPTSCANGYWGYVVTRDEYQLQYYEGGHTLYGPNTRKYVSEVHGNLLKDLIASGSGGHMADIHEYQLKSKSFYPKPQQINAYRKICMSPTFVHDNLESYWSFQWLDLPPLEMDFHLPLIQIHCKKMEDSGWSVLNMKGILVDDYGFDIAVFLIDNKADANASMYETRWYQTKLNPNWLYRFVVLPRKQMKALHSSVFTGESKRDEKTIYEQ